MCNEDNAKYRYRLKSVLKDAMKAKASLLVIASRGGALYWATGSSASLAGSMLGGFLIDADHIIDQLWSIQPWRSVQEKRHARR